MMTIPFLFLSVGCLIFVCMCVCVTTLQCNLSSIYLYIVGGTYQDTHLFMKLCKSYYFRTDEMNACDFMQECRLNVGICNPPR
jgi:hypothetical protein